MSWIKPMKPVIGEMPTGDGWAHELKWDGMRLCVTVVNGAVTLHAGSGRDVTSHFPEIAALGKHLGTNAVLDAEAVVFDNDQPSFLKLQSRIHVIAPSQKLVNEHPVVLVVFDLLELDGQAMTDVGYRDRRALLVQLLSDGPGWRVPPHVEGDGTPLLDMARDRDLEGIISKRIDGPYRSGSRSSDWVKVKFTKSQEFVVGGWAEGNNSLTGQIGSLLVGVYQERNNPGSPLLFAGSVGSGLTADYRRQITSQMVSRIESPFAELPKLDKTTYFLEPTMVVEVGFGQWLVGHQLRHPTFRGIRIDRDPLDVVNETHKSGSDLQ